MKLWKQGCSERSPAPVIASILLGPRRNRWTLGGGLMLRRVSAALVLSVVLAGCAQRPPGGQEPPVQVAVEPPALVEASPQTPRPTPESSDFDGQSESTTYQSVVDGDTIQTSAGRVRLIGIDTPERGQCGHEEASRAIELLLEEGDSVTLELPVGQNDRDRHGRLIRYVMTEDGIDLGLMQLQQGNAIARFDSTDGLPKHPREAAYHSAQIASSGQNGVVIVGDCEPEVTESAKPPNRNESAKPPNKRPGAKPSVKDRWWEQYSSCTRLKKNNAGHPTGPFDVNNPATAEIYDWFANQTGNRGDGDGDGLACE